MKFKKSVLFVLFILSYNLSAKTDNSGTWFTKKRVFRNGFEFLQLVLHKDKFIIAKLSFNEERKWEETRMQGVIERLGNELKFKPEMCTVFATKKLGLRWILIQAFDCDHNTIYLTKNGQDIILDLSFGLSENAIFEDRADNSKNSIPAIIVSGENKTFHAWSLAMRFLRKNSTASLRNKKLTVLETVDSTGTFKTEESFEIGETISLRNSSSFNLFD